MRSLQQRIERLESTFTEKPDAFSPVTIISFIPPVIGDDGKIRPGGAVRRVRISKGGVMTEIQILEYAAKNQAESFAEAFCAYTHPNYERGTLPDKIEKFMDKYIKDIPDVV